MKSRERERERSIGLTKGTVSAVHQSKFGKIEFAIPHTYSSQENVCRPIWERGEIDLKGSRPNPTHPPQQKQNITKNINLYDR